MFKFNKSLHLILWISISFTASLTLTSCNHVNYTFPKSLFVTYTNQDESSFLVLQQDDTRQRKLTLANTDLVDWRMAHSLELVLYNTPDMISLYTLENGKWQPTGDSFAGYQHVWLGDSHIVQTSSPLNASGIIVQVGEWEFIGASGSQSQNINLPPAIQYFPGHDTTYLIGITPEQIFRYDVKTGAITKILVAEQEGIDSLRVNNLFVAQKSPTLIFFTDGQINLINTQTLQRERFPNVQGSSFGASLSPSERYLLIPQYTGSRVLHVAVVNLTMYETHSIVITDDVDHYQEVFLGWKWSDDETQIANVAQFCLQALTDDFMVCPNQAKRYSLVVLDINTLDSQIRFTSNEPIIPVGWLDADNHFAIHTSTHLSVLDLNDHTPSSMTLLTASKLNGVWVIGE